MKRLSFYSLAWLALYEVGKEFFARESHCATCHQAPAAKPEKVKQARAAVNDKQFLLGRGSAQGTPNPLISNFTLFTRNNPPLDLGL